jgi:uncharacterized protein (TIGR01777 family)
MKVLVAGATGFLGRPLCGELYRRGHLVVAVSRSSERAAQLLGPSVETIGWDSKEIATAVASSDAIVNLAGEPIAARRWSAAYKEKLRSSRVDSTRKVVEAMRASGRPNQVLVNGSAVGYYGDRKNETITEQSPPGQGFLSELCVRWENEAREAEELGARVALARTGIVLGEDGGALEKMLPPFKLGIGGPLGSGNQWLPWIHRADVIRIIVWLLETPTASGPFNVTAPEPVTMRGFAKALGRALHRPAVLPVPGFVLRAIVGEMAESLLTGQKALPRAAEKLGFQWSYPTLESALNNLLGKEESE